MYQYISRLRPQHLEKKLDSENIFRHSLDIHVDTDSQFDVDVDVHVDVRLLDGFSMFG